MYDIMATKNYKQITFNYFTFIDNQGKLIEILRNNGIRIREYGNTCDYIEPCNLVLCKVPIFKKRKFIKILTRYLNDQILNGNDGYAERCAEIYRTYDW